nr:hypothetical protein [Saprospiraceae bacterium]
MKHIKIKVISVIFSGVILLLACTSESHETRDSPSIPIVNPNGDSELALLMREMYDDMYRIKSKIKEGQSAKITFDEHALFTAEPTDEDQVASDQYRTMGESFIALVNAFRQATTPDLKNHYTVLVQSCMSCHQYTCPGPMRRIENLYL